METRLIRGTDLAGGHPALDFVNTVGGVLGSDPRPEHELMRSYDDLVDVGLKTETLSEREARRLRRAARERPAEAEEALAAAYETRALIDSVFRPLSEGGEPPADALDALRDLGASATARGELVAGGPGGRLEWRWEHRDDLTTPLWPLAHAALELATHGPLERLKGCGRCRWLFLDTTKNRCRRWCSMAECGTDAKIERYVERRRARRAAAR